MQPQNNLNTKGGPHTFSPTILREYDIRGQIGINLAEDDAYALGLAFGTWLLRERGGDMQKPICVGYDGRTSSPPLAGALIGGLNDSGFTVVNIGLGPRLCYILPLRTVGPLRVSWSRGHITRPIITALKC